MNSEGVILIAAERQRQVEVEGWTAEHDNEHVPGTLAAAAACYAAHNDRIGQAELYMGTVDEGRSCYSRLWPREWDAWDKRRKHSRLRRLVIAGALIAAEIDAELRRNCR